MNDFIDMTKEWYPFIAILGVVITLLYRLNKGVDAKIKDAVDAHKEEIRILGISEEKNLDLYAENLTVKNIERVLGYFRGEIQQVPPMYSAKKIKGKKLYELARRGISLRREPSAVFIKEIKLLNLSLPYVTIYVECSKGTYIRQLAHDIGERVGCGAHLASLVRTGIGPFEIQDAVPFEKLKNEEKNFYENILQPE